MIINVAQQLKGFLGDRRQYSIDETTSEGVPIKAEITLVRTHRSILVTGQFNTQVDSVCSRCLDEFMQPVTFQLEEEFFPLRDLSTDMPAHVDEGTDAFFIGEDNILDLNEAVRQNMLINLPAKPICRPECAGLCQRCGCNLNYGPCHCSEESSDPRWSPLRELFSK